ncbi:hypothetical protein BHM03_00004441 [Ensete ventricosum]|nr:hypothetical protein BHM03_00004441 [Ensete ventricosum]
MTSFIATSFLLSLLLLPAFLSKSISPFHISDHLRRPPQPKPCPVTFAYLISASTGDVDRLKRLLTAIYHPGNCYLLHLDLEASPSEHARLSDFVSGHKTFARFRNVWLVGKSNLVTYRGPTMLSTTLHAMAVLLRIRQWDWFINLSASDYPLITQDDLIVAFSTLPRDLNFVQYTSHLGWKIKKRAKPIIIDPALYSRNKSEMIWSANQRGLPTAFKLFTGSAWTILSRSFAEYCILGWDNLPRTLLLYYTNFISSPEGYFQRMILSSVPFARKFKKNDPVLDKIDRELLRRRNGQFAHGGWCWDGKRGGCPGGNARGNVGVLRPGAGSRRLRALLTKMLSPRNFRRRQCR